MALIAFLIDHVQSTLQEKQADLMTRVIINNSINYLLNFCHAPYTLVCILHVLFLILTPWEVGVINIPNLQMKKVRLEWHVQSHMAMEWQIQDSNHDLADWQACALSLSRCSLWYCTELMVTFFVSLPPSSTTISPKKMYVSLVYPQYACWIELNSLKPENTSPIFLNIFHPCALHIR